MEQFNALMRRAVLLFAYVADPVALGFNIEVYVAQRRELEQRLRELAVQVENRTKETGTQQVGGGTASVAGGIASVAGILLAPVSGGLSLGLTFAGVAGGIAGSAATLHAGIRKQACLTKAGNEIKPLIEEVARMDQIALPLFEDLSAMLAELVATFEAKALDWKDVTLWTFGSGKIAYNGFNLPLKGLQAAAVLIWIDLAHVVGFQRAALLSSAAVEVATPGLAFSSKFTGAFQIFEAGTASAKVFSGTFAALGIGFGIWDIVKGAEDIQGSKHARAYRAIAEENAKITDAMVPLVRLLTAPDPGPPSQAQAPRSAGGWLSFGARHSH